MDPKIIIAALACLATACPAFAGRIRSKPTNYCPIFYSERPIDCQILPETFVDFSASPDVTQVPPQDAIEDLENAFEALVVLQDEYFDSDYGTWPSAIDWTAAVAGTVLAGTLNTLSKSIRIVQTDHENSWTAKENLISSYFTQLVGSYFGQDILSIRGEAFDDMLWVVLGWIDAINFIRVHSELHYSKHDSRVGDNTTSSPLKRAMESLPWHGNHWVGSFAHRARIFWNTASRGWDTKLCHGGMVWNPRLSPYKNAITNELWISASISMYRHFPGDDFMAPWGADEEFSNNGFPAKDPDHLAAAVEGYKWLTDVGMLNDQGLFVDGFHIDRSKPGNVECDQRDEMVYTYNQGVVLTGQRGLWAVTGSASYLEEGHKLIQSVIKATGWKLRHNMPLGTMDNQRPGKLPPWHGLGRGGILEEQCDASGTCSQDGQTFKGIFFHHLTAFCAPLDPTLVEPGMTVDAQGYQRVKAAHTTACSSYLGWVRHNAQAALATRDDGGRFGMWWGAGIFGNVIVSKDKDGIDHSAENTTDYRNQGTPDDAIWGGKHQWTPGAGGWIPEMQVQHAARTAESMAEDPNERGRGRTVETQIGGLALLRAWWEMSQVLPAEAE